MNHRELQASLEIDTAGKIFVQVNDKGVCLTSGTVIGIEPRRPGSTACKSAKDFMLKVYESGYGVSRWNYFLPMFEETEFLLDAPLNFTLGADL